MVKSSCIGESALVGERFGRASQIVSFIWSKIFFLATQPIEAAKMLTSTSMWQD